MKERKTIIQQGQQSPIISDQSLTDSFLKVRNYLSEFKTREEKELALKNLGIDREVWGYFVNFSEGFTVNNSFTVGKDGALSIEELNVGDKFSIKDGIIRASQFIMTAGAVASNDGVNYYPFVCFKGKWTQGIKYSYYDEVTHLGSKFICVNRDGTFEAPSYRSYDWILSQGSSELRLEIDSSNGDVFVNTVDTELTAILYSGFTPVESDEGCVYSWTRQSSDEVSDKIWNTQHMFVGKKIRIQSEIDIPLNEVRVYFTCECVVPLAGGLNIKLNEIVEF